MSIRQEIEAAFPATAERLSPGSGESALRHAKNDISVISATSEDYDSRFAGQDLAIVSPAVFETKHPDGDPVTIKKRHDGLIAVFRDGFLFVRGMGFGAREVKALRKDEVTVEKVTTVLDGAETPGLRITGRSGPKFALAIALEKAASDAAAQEAVRDEVYDALTA